LRDANTVFPERNNENGADRRSVTLSFPGDCAGSADFADNNDSIASMMAKRPFSVVYSVLVKRTMGQEMIKA
jgi:hypothetical protein